MIEQFEDVGRRELISMNRNEIEKQLSSPTRNNSSTLDAFHSSTFQPAVWFTYNSSLSDVENSNASRHFADYSESTGVLGMEAIIIVVVVSLIPVSVIACMIFVISFNCFKRRNSLWSTSPNSTIDNKTTASSRFRKSAAHSDIENENTTNDHYNLENDDETATAIETPLSVYPGDIFQNYFENSKSSLTTPISNSSIITMTMRNNHLIVETEERIPCSLLNAEQMYGNGENFANTYTSSDIQEYELHDSFDDTDSFNEHQSHHHDTSQHGYMICCQDRRSFYEPTTSRQADEEDQHVELFHKNILASSKTENSNADSASSQADNSSASIPSCNRDDKYTCEDLLFSSCSFAANTNNTNTNTGYSQPDSTGSSSSTSRRALTDYSYSNQSEYVAAELVLQKYPVYGTTVNFENGNCTSFVPVHSFHHSVQQLTDCSSSEFPETSK